MHKKVDLRPQSQRVEKSFRIKTQEVQRTFRSRLGSIQAKPNSLVFQSQIVCLQNYFSFLQTKLGRKEQVSKFIKSVPRCQKIHEQYDRMQSRQTQVEESVNQTENVQFIKIKFNTTRQMSQIDQNDPYRNGEKRSSFKTTINHLKIKSYQSKRKKHSYLMQRMNYIPKKVNFSPSFDNNLKQKQVGQSFFPLGCISKVPNKAQFPKKPKSKLSDQLMKGITYKRSQNKTVFIKTPSGSRHMRHSTTQKTDEGPWNIVDPTDYNPRSLYSSYY